MLKKSLILFGAAGGLIYAGEEKHLGTKQPYIYTTAIKTEVPEGYKPIFINYLGRHGSRHLSSPKYDVSLYELLSMAEKEGEIKGNGLKLKESIAELMKIEKGNYGLLTDLGKEEKKGIARRMYENYGEVFGKEVKATSTHVERAQQSRDSFLEELAKNTPSANFKVSTNPEKGDTLLRFYDVSKEYAKFKKAGDWKKDLKIYENKNNFNYEILSNILKDDFIKKLEKGEIDIKDPKGKTLLNTPTSAVRNLYDLYIIQSNIGKSFGFENYFTQAQLKWYEELDNIDDFYEKGPGKTGQDIAMNISFPLLKDFIATTDEAFEKKSASANLRFAHAETTIPFISLLEINGMNVKENDMSKVYDKWLGREVSGMATNIQWILYSSSNGENLVKVLHNEKEAELPLKSDMKPYYRWEDVKKFYEEKLSNIEKSMPEEDYNLLTKK